MAVIEPRRKSPNSKNSVKMAERCCSRLARDSGKGYLLILTYHYVRICDTKKETSPIPPFMSRTQGNRSACKRRRSVVHVTHSKRLVSIRSPRRLLRGILRGEFMHRRYSFRNALIGLLTATCLLPSSVMGQETRATLSGTVTDPSTASVAGAALVLVNVQTGVETRTETSQMGQYRFLFVNPGTYKLTTEMAGFHTQIREGILLETGQAATLDVTLQLGAQAESVTVGADAPLIEAEKADRGMVVTGANLAELPTITRTPVLLATLAPGVTNTAVRYDWTPFSNSGLTTWSINGSTAYSTGFLIDGAPNDAVYQSAPTIAYVPPSDAVQEFRVVANAYDAQYGRNGGGVISMVTKGGTNSPHGSVYEYAKRPSLNATSFSNNSKGLGPDNTPLDQYGFSFGGPVYIPKVYNGKDKTFFFTAWEAYKQNQLFPQNDISSVPTVAMSF